MRYPSGVAIAPDGRIWVVDSGNSRIGIFEPDGTLVEYWGTAGDGPGEFVLHRANGDGSSNVAFAPDGSFYIIDAGGQQIQRWSAEREFIREWGGFGNEPGKFIAPAWIATDAAGNVYVIDGERNVVELFDPEGDLLQTFEASDRPGSAWWISVDPVGDLWVGTCCPESSLRKFDPTGRLLATFGVEANAPLVFDAGGRIYTGHFPTPGAEDLVVVFDEDLNLLARFGGVPGTPDGMGFPWGIALDASGNLYVSNYGAEDGTTGSLHKYRLVGELAADPEVATSPSAPPTTTVDGTGFDQPFQIEIPADGSVEVAQMDPRIVAFMEPAGEAGLTLWVVDQLADDPCQASVGEPTTVANPDALIGFLERVPQLDVVQLGARYLGGHPARVIELTAIEGPEGCGRDVILWSSGGEQFTIPPGWTARIAVAAVGGQTVVAEMWAEDLASWVPIAEPIVDSLRFDATGHPPEAQITTLPPGGTYQATIPSKSAVMTLVFGARR
jgi:sugar lactone lactonase YvrE